MRKRKENEISESSRKMDSKKEGSDSNFGESERGHQKSRSMKEGRKDPPSIFFSRYAAEAGKGSK